MNEARHGAAEAVTALILAGGKGRRMQGQDKGLLELAGRPLISHVIERVRPQVQAVMVSANRNQEQYLALADTVLGDDPQLGEQFAGPLAGVLSGLEVATTAYVLVLPCDTPCLPENLLPVLLEEIRRNQADITYVHDGERDQHLLMLLRRQLAPVLRQWLLAGGRAVHEWIATQRYCVARFNDPGSFINLNTADDCAVFARKGCG